MKSLRMLFFAVVSGVSYCAFPAVDPMISITPVTRSMEQAGGTGAINTSGSGTWTASVSDDWILIVGDKTGTAGYAVGYTVSANEGVEDRIGYVYVSGYAHTIIQSGVGAELATYSANFEKDGGRGSVSVIAPSGKTWGARSNVDWIHIAEAVTGSQSISFTVDSYNEVSTRSGTLTVAGETFTVHQTGVRMRLSEYSAQTDYFAETIKIRINALSETLWSVSSDCDWITIVDDGNGQGADSIKISVSENESYSPRSATVIIGTEKFTVNQFGRTSLIFRVSGTEASYGVDGGAGARIVVSATPDLDWSAQSDSDWIEIYDGYRAGSGNGNVVYKVKPNPTLYPRSGVITLQAEDSAVSVKRVEISQAAATATLTMSEYEFEAAGESVVVGVNTGTIVGWNVINTNSWLSISGLPSSGPGELTLKAAANTSVKPRNGVVMIADHPFMVSQKGRGVNGNYTSRVFDTDGKTTGADAENIISVSAEDDVSWTADASDATWIVVYEGKSGKGDGVVKYIVAPYVGNGEMRTGTITIGDKTVYITQRPYDLSIDPTGVWMDGNAGAGEIQVALDINGVWNAIATESWIIIDEKHDAGTGSGKVLFKYTDTNTGKERTGKIIIAGEEYTITQAARQNITIATTVSNHGGRVDGGGIYNIGTEIELAAIADEGYEFVSWSLSGGGQSSESVLKVVAMENGTYTANFKPLIPTLQIDSANLRGVLLRWKHLPWAVNYHIWRGVTSATNAATRIASLSNDGQCQYIDITGVENQKYWYWIEAAGAEDDVWSNGMQAKREKQTFSIIYKNLRGASHSNPTTYLEGNRIQFTPPTSRRGYTFIGWNPSQIDSTVSGDVTVRAIWAQNEYVVRFDPNGGSGDMPNENFMYGYWRYLDDANITWSGYSFAGWSTTERGEVIHVDSESIKNLTSEMNGIVTLYAVWNALVGIQGDENPTITGDDTTGFVIKPSDGMKEIVVVVPEGFDAGKVTVEIDPSVASLVANGAKFKVVKGGYDITPYLSIPSNGSVIYPNQSVVKDEFAKEALDSKKGVEIILDPNSPSITLPYTRSGLTYTLKEGRNVNGLEDGDSKLGDGQPWSPRITVKGGRSAFYTITVNLNDVSSHPTPPVPEPVVYTIRFDANGGVGDTVSSYNAGSTLGELPTPSREGYEFVGWFTAASGGTQVAASTVVTGPKTLYAKWTIKSYEVVFDANGGNGGVTKSYTHGVTLDELPTPTRGGYKFLGWFTAAEGGVAVTPETVITVGMTVYARWELFDGHDKVQLWEGGPYWATTNIGAEKPEDYGYYFWWGDTVGYKRENDKWVASDGSNSNFSFDEDNAPTYNKSDATVQSEGWITADGVLAPEHDAAKKHWGGDWRMPTKQEFDDLNSKCDWTWTPLNGVNGYVIRGRGDYASNSIFLPCAGSGGGTSLGNAGSNGFYWSSVLSSGRNNAWSLNFGSGFHIADYRGRYRGQCVRPLQGFIK